MLCFDLDRVSTEAVAIGCHGLLHSPQFELRVLLIFITLYQGTNSMAAKPGYFFRQSGVIPYRVRKGVLEILLITSRKKRRWIIPKGIIEPDFSARHSAAKEALEEAGARGSVHNKLLGIYKDTKFGRSCSVKVYPMRVTRIHKVWEETDRDREWVTLKKALKLVSNGGLKRVIKKLPQTI
jgi:phosphohistidine phosphatase